MGIMGLLDRAGFDAMVDFVQKSYDQLEVDTLDTLSEEQSEKFNERKDEIVKQLDGSIREASAQKHKPVEQLLKDMRGAVRTAMPDSAPNPEIIQHFEREGEKARVAQDTFGGTDGRFQLPSVFGEALGFLRTVFAPPTPSATPAPKADVPTPTTTAAQPELAQTQGSPRDPRVAEFVRNYFGDHFDATPMKRNTGEFAALLPKAEREVFEKLPKEEKAFIQTLRSAERGPYSQMPKEEQAFFRAMKPSERGQFIAMTPDERKYFRELNPDQRAAYLTLHPDQRARVREQGAEGRTALLNPETFKHLSTKDPVELARTVSSDALNMLGINPPKEGTTDPKNRHAVLMEKTQGLMMNFLQANPGNVAAARVQVLKALLGSPELQASLMQDLEARLGQADTRKTSRKSESYAEHFKKIRPIVLQHAETLLRPDLDRDGLLAGLEKAVEVSAEFAAAHPPRKRDLRASKNLKFRFITG